MRLNIFFTTTMLFIAALGHIYAQSFTSIEPGFGVCEFPAAEWADIDNDGDLDAFFLGNDASEIPAAHLFRNDGGGTFIELSTSIAGLAYAACSFGDMDNDGLADLAISGYNGSAAVSAIYRNDGGGSFTEISSGITNLSQGSMAWADYDNDGLNDLLLSGTDNSGIPQTLLYHNDGASAFSNSGATFTGLTNSSLAWSDFDLDGDMDFAICGEDNSQQALSVIYLNEGGSFSDISAGLTGFKNSTLAWGDYNNDSYVDLLLSGSTNVDTSGTRIYKNNAGNSFSPISINLYGVSSGSAIWGDFNNDGSLDFIVAGHNITGGNPPPPPVASPLIYLYANQGSDQFTENEIMLEAPGLNTVVCGDYDNDSDLDLLVCGDFVNYINGDESNARIFRNDITTPNIPPSAPTGLNYSFVDDELILSWNASTDDNTPSTGLNYNLRLGTQNDNMDVQSALASLSSGYRRIVHSGNSSGNLSWSIYGMGIGEYYASVQAIDHNYEGSAFSDNLLITVPPTATFTVTNSLCVFEEAEVIYTGNASPTAQYVWDFDEAIIVSGSGQGPYILYWETEGVKEITLSVTENGATSTPYMQEVQVTGSAQKPGAITGDTELCQGSAESDYFITPLTGVTTYDWGLNPPSAGIISGTQPLATVSWDPDFSGLAYVFVRGTNACGTGPYSDSLIVNVLSLAEKPGTPEGPQELCKNPGNSTYVTSGSPGALSYLWGIWPETAGILTSSGTQATINWDNNYTGEVYVFVSANNLCGLGPVSDSLLVSIQAAPDVNAGENQSIPTGTSTQLNGSVSGGSGSYSYFWTPSDKLIDPLVLDPITVDLMQSIQFVLHVTDEVSGCVTQDQVVVTVTGGALTLEVMADPEQICEGESTQLLALAGGGSGIYTYSWTSSPPGFISNIADTADTPLVNTMYYASINDGTNTVSDSVQVLVDPLPGDAGVISGPVDVCSGMELVNYSIDPVSNATYYNWELPEGFFGNSNSSSISLIISPNIIVGGDIEITPYNDCGAGTPATLTVVVNTAPERPDMPTGPDTLCITTDTISYYNIDVPVSGASSYEWMLLPAEAGIIMGNGLTAEVHWSDNWVGQAAIGVRAGNDCGYSDWSEPFDVFLFSCLGISDEALSPSLIKVYPNPVKSILNVELWMLNNTDRLWVSAWDIYGRKCLELEIPGGQKKIQLDMSAFTNGLYILSISDHQHLLVNKKFVLSK